LYKQYIRITESSIEIADEARMRALDAAQTGDRASFNLAIQDTERLIKEAEEALRKAQKMQ
jgi:cytosine/adenosine deaminase-related metal-dependent hydrolase